MAANLLISAGCVHTVAAKLSFERDARLVAVFQVGLHPLRASEKLT